MIYSACTPEMASGDTQNDKDAKETLARYFRITILENAGGSLCPPLRLVEWVKNEILQCLRTMSSPRLQPSTESLSGNRFGCTFFAERVNENNDVPVIPARYHPDNLNPSCRLTPYFTEIHLRRAINGLVKSHGVALPDLFAERKNAHIHTSTHTYTYIYMYTYTHMHTEPGMANGD